MNLIKLPEQVDEWISYGWNAAGDLVTVTTMGDSDACVVHQGNVELLVDACEKAIRLGNLLSL